MASVNRLVAIVGATGTGKSQLSLEVAQGIRERGGQAEIVNADAMQLYRGMDIGTAKLSPAERAQVAHHMFDVLDVTQEASVADYQRDAQAVIDDVLARGATPILVGGSGLYVSSVLFEFDFPGHDDAIRARLEDELEQVGPGLMFARLKELAPEAAARIDSQNARRVVRALEVIEMTGSTAALGTLPEDAVYWRPTSIFELRENREVLTERLDRRVEAMWAGGMLDEVRGLIPQGIEQGVTARRAIGYAQALAQLEGALTEAEAIEETQSLTRRYARRQVSWFKRYADATVLPAGAEGNAAVVCKSLFE
jgi:tRNA dimethylallyltransferase